MAVKDKLVNLEDLKVVNDDLLGKCSGLKSALSKYKPASLLVTSGRGINASGEITTTSSYAIWYFPVIAGRTYKFTTVDSKCYYAWFANSPYAGGPAAYDNTRHVGQSLSVEVKAPITGYLTFRSTSASSEDVSAYLFCAADYEADDEIALMSTVFTELNLSLEYTSGRGINSSGAIATSSSYKIWYCKVSQGINYKFITQDSAYYYAWFTKIPIAGETSYNGTRYTANSNIIEATAPINGYLVFRSANSFENATATAFSAIDVIARDEINTIMAEPDTVYVSTIGNDNNRGSESEPYLTIARAIDSGATTIVVAPGTYQETFAPYYLRRCVSIIGNGNGVVISGFRTQLAFRLSNVTIKNVTVDMTATTIRGYVNPGESPIVNFYETRTGDEGSYVYSNPFTPDEGTSYIDIPTGVPYVWTGTEYASNSASGFFMRDGFTQMVNCSVINAPYMGFRFEGGFQILEQCTADGARIDGFNGHDTTNNITEGFFINCIAKNCGDDGLSYHENGIIHVLGGEYSNNASTGIAPHNNCNCDIRDAYIHHNGRAGIEALYGSASQTTETPPTMILSGCIFEGNTGNAVTARYYIVKASANGASGNGTDSVVNDGGSTITTFTLM